MYFSQSILAVPVLALLASNVVAIPHRRDTQSRPDNHTLNRERADAVKEAFTFAWDGYHKYAMGHDELHPVSNGYGDSRNGWGASAVDAFSTALVMQIPEIVDTILEYIPTINFDETADEISLFETTIRYLGGLLSGYDLLKGPLSNLASNATAVEAILAQAERLGSNLAFAFDTESGVPTNSLYFNPSRTGGGTTNGLATTGTLVLEWTRLGDLTGNKTFSKLSQKGESYLLAPKPASSEPWPGLVGMNINIKTGQFEDAFGGWVGGADSFYEYLIKMYVYDTTRFESYKDRWVAAADSSIAQLASHPSSRPELTFMAMYDGKKLIYQSQHLACFDGGSFILGGLVLKEQKYIDFGIALVDGCEDTYSSTVTGIGPESFRWVTKDTDPKDSRNPQPPADQADFFAKSGFFITDSSYVLRPEVIESFYYAYRATGDQKYRDWAWNAFVAINSTARTGSGFAELKNVNAPKGGGFNDFQDSFLFAEVLKYSYLIHSPDNVWQVEHNGVNQFVFNTEAHPFKVAGPPI
ncbi:alpha-1,2-Mannosidase [Venustampulla echinocandica]|uniref:alpha-1,2-Mannosidase n=1 Tax=Venustampulla echinocandica TaxID=2656787 RepID=A0A370U2R1_9HELO|nr:alpha-1,2-Mannosidase [Venustampulla echinocandica]RDL42045.1 alpha-1,2-Mannosidase [Venustampulla echinocandica]